MQNLFETLIAKVNLLIDRIKFSVPLHVKEDLLFLLGLNCTEEEVEKEGRWWPGKEYSCKQYRCQGCKITVSWSEPNLDKPAMNPRVFVNVSDPNIGVQCLCQYIFSILPMGTWAWSDSVLVSEVEVAYDLYGESKADAEKIKKFVVEHIFMRNSRKVIVRTHKGITYIACKGYIRKGIKGIRCYVKTENGESFCRVEMQFNRPYFLKHGITCEKSLPFSPESFQVLGFVDFLEHFSEVGVKNYSSTILRKQGINPSVPNYNQQHRSMSSYVREEVLGGTRGPGKKVHVQIAQLARLNKEMGVSVNFMNYFNNVTNFKEVIVCLGEISIEEEGSSKRMAIFTSNI